MEMSVWVPVGLNAYLNSVVDFDNIGDLGLTLCLLPSYTFKLVSVKHLSHNEYTEGFLSLWKCTRTLSLCFKVCMCRGYFLYPPLCHLNRVSVLDIDILNSSTHNAAAADCVACFGLIYHHFFIQHKAKGKIYIISINEPNVRI